jgi:hypothetical protein
MRLMTTHALGVAADEQRAFRHNRRILAVAFAARAERGRGRRVLLRVARRTHSVLRLAERGMRRADRAVAASAGRRDRRLISMRTVTTHTLGRGVHDDSGDLTLCLGVTTCAVSWAVGLERAAIARVGLTRIAGEGVTIGAIGAGRFTEALLSQPSGVFDARPVLVAGRAATRRYHTDGRGTQLVTEVAGNALFDHVHPMTRDTSIGAPSQWHVNTLARRTTRARGSSLARTSAESRQHERGEQPEKCGEPRRIVHCPIHPKAASARNTDLSVADSEIPSVAILYCRQV